MIISHGVTIPSTTCSGCDKTITYAALKVDAEGDTNFSVDMGKYDINKAYNVCCECFLHSLGVDL